MQAFEGFPFSFFYELILSFSFIPSFLSFDLLFFLLFFYLKAVRVEKKKRKIKNMT